MSRANVITDTPHWTVVMYMQRSGLVKNWGENDLCVLWCLLGKQRWGIWINASHYSIKERYHNHNKTSRMFYLAPYMYVDGLDDAWTTRHPIVVLRWIWSTADRDLNGMEYNELMYVNAETEISCRRKCCHWLRI